MPHSYNGTWLKKKKNEDSWRLRKHIHGKVKIKETISLRENYSFWIIDFELSSMWDLYAV